MRSWAVLLLVSLPACFAPPGPMERLNMSAYDLNTATRFGRMDVALEHVAQDAQVDFMARHAKWGRGIRVVDVELVDGERGEIVQPDRLAALHEHHGPSIEHAHGVEADGVHRIAAFHDEQRRQVEPRDAVAGDPVDRSEGPTDDHFAVGLGRHRPHIAVEAAAEVGAERRIEGALGAGVGMCR